MKKLVINKQYNTLAEYKFIEFIKNRLSSLIIGEINSPELIRFDKYFVDNKDIFSVDNKIITAKNIIIQGCNNFEIKTFPDYYSIELNKNKVMSNFTDFKIYDLCNFIDTGNVEIKPFPVFSDCIIYIKNNLSNLEDLYANGGIV